MMERDGIVFSIWYFVFRILTLLSFCIPDTKYEILDTNHEFLLSRYR